MAQSLWTVERLLEEACDGRVGERFGGPRELAAFGRDELLEGARRALARPQEASFSPASRALSSRLLAAQWTLLLESLGLPEPPRVLEPCAGGSDPVIVALDAIYGARASYVTVNLNRGLAAELARRAADLDLQVEIIEDDARNLSDHFEPASFDCVCLHHAVNDILQTAVAATQGMDTRGIDWWPTERQMIEWMAQQHEKDGLQSVGLPELRAVLQGCARVLRPGAPMCFDHWTSKHHLGLDWFPGRLFNDMIPLARRLIPSLSIPLEEVTPEGLDAQWWMVLRRIG
ncbi:MAG: hypothetical protein ACP5KN_02300 [Armatimonadota bacterium]